MVGNTYAQNVRTLDEYYERIDRGELAVFRGVALTHDDELRRAVITQLICNFMLDKRKVERQWQISFDSYFAGELQRLAGMVEDGLVRLDDERIEVLPPGRLLIRNLCMVFDRYLSEKGQGERFSRVI
jgi:oxygen-independent coproporphyrinogen-3 oxidase